MEFEGMEAVVGRFEATKKLLPKLHNGKFIIPHTAFFDFTFKAWWFTGSGVILRKKRSNLSILSLEETLLKKAKGERRIGLLRVGDTQSVISKEGFEKAIEELRTFEIQLDQVGTNITSSIGLTPKPMIFQSYTEPDHDLLFVCDCERQPDDAAYNFRISQRRFSATYTQTFGSKRFKQHLPQISQGVRASIRTQTQAILDHLETAHGMLVVSLEVEFIKPITSPKIVLLSFTRYKVVQCAPKWKYPESIPNSEAAYSRRDSMMSQSSMGSSRPGTRNSLAGRPVSAFSHDVVLEESVQPVRSQWVFDGKAPAMKSTNTNEPPTLISSPSKTNYQNQNSESLNRRVAWKESNDSSPARGIGGIPRRTASSISASHLSPPSRSSLSQHRTNVSPSRSSMMPMDASFKGIIPSASARSLVPKSTSGKRRMRKSLSQNTIFDKLAKGGLGKTKDQRRAQAQGELEQSEERYRESQLRLVESHNQRRQLQDLVGNMQEENRDLRKANESQSSKIRDYETTMGVSFRRAKMQLKQAEARLVDLGRKLTQQTRKTEAQIADKGKILQEFAVHKQKHEALLKRIGAVGSLEEIESMQRDMDHMRQELESRHHYIITLKQERAQANDALRQSLEDLENAKGVIRFAHQQMCDMKTPGVEPPKRIAGGFTGLPMPGEKNVLRVVDTLIRYRDECQVRGTWLTSHQDGTLGSVSTSAITRHNAVVAELQKLGVPRSRTEGKTMKELISMLQNKTSEHNSKKKEKWQKLESSISPRHQKNNEPVVDWSSSSPTMTSNGDGVFKHEKLIAASPKLIATPTKGSLQASPSQLSPNQQPNFFKNTQQKFIDLSLSMPAPATQSSGLGNAAKSAAAAKSKNK